MPALRIVRAAKKTLAGIRAAFRGALDQFAAAFRANGRAAVPFLQRGDMRFTGRPGFREHAGTQRLDQLADFFIREKRFLLALDVTRIALGQDVRRQGRFQLRFAPEHYYRMQLVVIDAEEFRQCLSVPVVLMQRILKTVFLPEQALRPLRIALVAEDPAFHVLGLDHTQAEARNDDMVDLRGAVGCRYRDVVDRVVNLVVQHQRVRDRALRFADPAF